MLFVKKKDFKLSIARYVSLVLVFVLSAGVYILLKCTGAPKSTEISTTQASEESAESVSASEPTVKDGTYSATALGYEGDITVEIVVQNGEVIDVYFTSYDDDEEYKTFSDGLIEAIKADPLGEIDTVSGATFSTRGVLKAYHDALAQAGIEKH